VRGVKSCGVVWCGGGWSFWCWLGGEFEVGVGARLASGVGDEGELALGEDVEAGVSAALGPFVGLLGEGGADEAGDRVAVGKDAD
jgi:hypothetical protein